MHPRDTAAFIDGGQGLLPLGSLTNRDGGVVVLALFIPGTPLKTTHLQKDV